jgi:hypothetical protein
MSYLRCCVYLCIVVSNTYCIVFLLCFCSSCRLVYPILSVSLDCPFVIAPSVFSNVCVQLSIAYLVRSNQNAT